MLLQAPLQVILRAVMLSVRGFGHLQESHEEGPRGGYGDLELEPAQDHLFHIQHLLSRVGVVSDVYAIPHLRGVNLFILAGDEKGRDAHQLKLAAVHVLQHAEAVYDMACQVQRRIRELEFKVDLHNPVDQDRAHLAVYIHLRVHVHRWSVLFLYGSLVFRGRVFGFPQKAQQSRAVGGSNGSGENDYSTGV